MRPLNLALTLVSLTALSGACAPMLSHSPGTAVDADRGLVLAVDAGGWDAVAPWRGAVADAYARANAVLASREFRQRMMMPQEGIRWSGTRTYYQLFGARLDAGKPYRVRFRAALGTGQAVAADCHGTIWLGFPKVLKMPVDAFAAELARVAAMQGLRGRTPCRGEVLQASGQGEAIAERVRRVVVQLAGGAFPGGPKTVAEAVGWAQSPKTIAAVLPPTRREQPKRAAKAVEPTPAPQLAATDSAGPLKQYIGGLAKQTTLAPRVLGPQTVKPVVVLSYEPLRRGKARLRVNARPWASCSVGSHPARTTPFAINVGSGEHIVRCKKGVQRATETIFIPKRPFSRLARAKLIVTTDGADRCYIDGIRYDGSGVSVDVAPGVRRVECVYEGDTLSQGVRVTANRVIPVHFDVRQLRFHRRGLAQLRLNARPWARCGVDGGAMRVTPMTLWVKPGTHNIVCENHDGRVTRRIKVQGRRRTRINLDMANAEDIRRPKDKGNAVLTLTADPWANCSIDGKMVGVARIVTVVRPGARRVTCEHKGTKQTRTIRVRAGEPTWSHFRF